MRSGSRPGSKDGGGESGDEDFGSYAPTGGMAPWDGLQGSGDEKPWDEAIGALRAEIGQMLSQGCAPLPPAAGCFSGGGVGGG